MTESEIDDKVREYYNELLKSCKNEHDEGQAVNKAIDLYFSLKRGEAQQLDLF